jgi:hypothetical protein
MTLPAIADRIPLTAHVRTFKMKDGRSVAIDRRNIALVREEEPKLSSISLKLSGQKPLLVECPFSEALTWWLTPNPLREDRDAER